ncbi:putative membrane protein YeiH [Porphyromonas crevioricanis JCM 15906]|uniref:Putative membrane protein YeiH n=1 Tax=Porphyromonas crevioricanis JCM 15906 TaxID=1305617 RepID=T1DQY7_9PORP|nr:putative sulfate exporter family transporter [Porphyromonas crevioricanis]GAD04604.1 putative membrane protein YeiH [Porphyromonas crevioricanis JCM 15906]SJZ68049.1 conserved hypothetical integral membrane protein [Porphyromonas crevioricanis]
MKDKSIAGIMGGILLMMLFSVVAFVLSALPPFRSLHISPLIIGILLGMIYANTFRSKLPASWEPGLRITAKNILRIAIVCFGFRLTLNDVAAVGWQGLLVDGLVVSSVILLGTGLGRLFRLDRNLSILTASGSAICGAAAVLGTEPVLGDKPYKTVIAVSTVVLFGTMGMFLYPALYHSGLLSSLSEHQLAIYTGSTLHEVAHVAGAGAAMDNPIIANLATITKMIRVILLAPFLLLLSFFTGRRKQEYSGRREISIPWFAIWFLLVIILNSWLGQMAQMHDFSDSFQQMGKYIEQADTFALTMAMAALGSDAGFRRFRETGFKPFLLALLLFIWLIFFGYTAVRLIC